ncbi:hypothetical protein [Halovivax cerinus]|uniref:DUF7982 domain-containing protein n=1 Tax=Halovivax cerinus TaxID=1487865 RepID=A0ABD5NRA8_9EURY|nr:hypothetical protein [Halovivax cerinus]
MSDRRTSGHDESTGAHTRPDETDTQQAPADDAPGGPREDGERTDPGDTTDTGGARRTDGDGATAGGDPTELADAPAETLAAQVELLTEENRRLRREYARARRSRYRRTAAGLGLLGAAAALAGLVVPAGREVLVVIGAIGLFGGLLTYYVTPERFVAASTGERVYAALASNHAALVDELGLREERYYLPDRSGRGPRLYVPQLAAHELPEGQSGPIVTDADARGLLVEPTGADLYAAFADAAVDDPGSDAGVATHLADAVVTQFELARHADASIDASANGTGGRVTVAVSDAAFGPLDRFDHPIPSVLAVGLATALTRPVECSVSPGDDRADWLVTVHWDGTDY